jgi:hypothetical protein
MARRAGYGWTGRVHGAGGHGHRSVHTRGVDRAVAKGDVCRHVITVATYRASPRAGGYEFVRLLVRRQDDQWAHGPPDQSPYRVA